MSADLAQLIERVRHHQMTPAETRAQRVSFVYGQMNGKLSKEEVRERLARINGWPEDER